MTNNIDKTAVEKGIAEMIKPLTKIAPEPGLNSPSQWTLSALMDEIEKRHRENGEQIATAKKILSMIVGGLK